MPNAFKLFTIGFTASTAEHFFERLKNNGVKKIIDTRLWPDTQLSGFARRKDLPYFLKNLSQAAYEYQTLYAPSTDILTDYKNKQINWQGYTTRYLALLQARNVLSFSNLDYLQNACLLCAECTPQFCHRRLLAEYLQQHVPALEIVHL
jgi:uncharacterized protein (DUF488 family)